MNRLISLATKPLLPTLVGAACGAALMILSVDGSLQMMFILFMMGILGLLVFARLGLVRWVMLFAFGFSVIINPRKFFGVSGGDLELLAWTVTVSFLSFLDIAAVLLLVIYARDSLVSVWRMLPRSAKLALFGFFAIMLASLYNVHHMEEARAHIYFEFKCLFVFVAVFGLIAGKGSDGARATLRPILIGLAAGMGMEALVVCLEYVGLLQTGHSFMGIRVGSLTEHLGRGVEALRVGGTYQHPNYLAVAAGAIFLLFWQLEMDSHKKAEKSPYYWLGMGASLICLVLPLSRGGWLATACGGALYAATMLSLRGRAWLRSLPWKYLFPAMLAVLMVGLYFSGPIYDKIVHSDPLNIDSRGELNRMAIRIIGDHPWLGAGIAQHGFAMQEMDHYGKFQDIAGLIPVVHNIYLLIVTEIGIIGGVFYMLVPLLAIYYALRACMRAPDHPLTGLACALGTSIFVFLVADLFGPSLRKVDIVYLFWILIAMAYAVAALIDGDVRQDLREQRERRLARRRKRRLAQEVYVDVCE